MADTIYLDSFPMDKLICLCAHDFKHDFIEDSDRPKLALGSVFSGGTPKLQYRGTSSTTETVDEGETIEAAKDNLKMGNSSLVFPGTPLSEEEGYDENPEDFPLACYIYLNIADMCKNEEETLDKFNTFCDNLGNFNERIGLQKKKSEARQKRREAIDAEAQQSSKKRRTTEGGNSVVGGSLSGKPPKIRWKQEERQKIQARERQKKKEANAAEKREAQRRRLRNLPGRDVVGRLKEQAHVFSPEVETLIEWNKMLEIYKEWLSSPVRGDFYKDINDLQGGPPDSGDKRTFLISSSEWEEYEHVEGGGGDAYKVWVQRLCPQGCAKSKVGAQRKVKTGLESIINECRMGGQRDGRPYPLMNAVKISTQKWNNIRKFSSYLLKEWEKLVRNSDDKHIYDKNKISNLSFNDEKMWKDSEEYYFVRNGANIIKGKDDCKVKPCRPFDNPVIKSMADDRKIINNSATLSKYIENSGLSYTCPIPSIIDPQSVCNSIPHQLSPPPPLDYSVKIVDRQTEGRTIEVQIKNNPQHSTSYQTKISFFNVADGPPFIEGNDTKDFINGGGPLSAYNVTLMFIQRFLGDKINQTDLGDWVNTIHPKKNVPVAPFSNDEETLRSIAGIFALKLMGDFSQELYAISKNSTIDPLLFLANDRVSAARYLLLKVHGKREGGDNIIAEPGGGGFLSYGGKKNNYFLLMGPAPQPGGGKKKKKVKKTKTKTKSRKKVKKTKRKSRRKSRKSRKKT